MGAHRSENILANLTLCEAEIAQIRKHQEHLGQLTGVEFSFEQAKQDWLDKYAMSWRQARQRDFMQRQLEEILKHKWIESQKAQRDLGRDAAIDWIQKYAAQWRDWYDQQDDDWYERHCADDQMDQVVNA